MKIILSHDIDHLHWNEHYFKDLYLPGSLLRNSKGFVTGKIDLKLYLKRLKCWGRIHHLPELIDFYNKRNIKANFFFGMSNALGLSYHYKNSEEWIKLLLSEGHKVGVHGISYKNKIQIEIEYKRFKELSDAQDVGIRTHYLRLSGYTLEFFENQNYLYDTSIQGIFHPFRINNLWEIPISIMDASLVENFQLNNDIEVWKEATLAKMKEAVEKKLSFFVVNFHDLYFSSNYPVIKQWYYWFIDHIQANNYQVISFEDAINILNKTEK